MSEPNTLLEGWQSFEAAVVPERASEEQRRDMFMAFFAGAGFLFRALQSATEATDDQALAAFTGFANEINDHVAALCRRPFVIPPRRRPS